MYRVPKKKQCLSPAPHKKFYDALKTQIMGIDAVYVGIVWGKARIDGVCGVGRREPVSSDLRAIALGKFFFLIKNVMASHSC